MVSIKYRTLWLRCQQGIALIAFSLLCVIDAEADSRTLTLAKAVDRALMAHPAIEGAELRLNAETQRGAQFAQTTPWSLNMEVENVAGTGSVSGFDGAETTVGFNKVIERGGKRERRTAVGAARLALSTLERARVEIDIASSVTKAFLMTLTEQHRADLSDESVAMSKAILASVERRVSVGRSSEADLAIAEIALAQAEVKSIASKRALQARLNELSILLGEPAPTFDILSADLFRIQPKKNLAHWEKQLENNLESKRLALQTDLRHQQRRLAEAAEKPDLTVGAGIRHLSTVDDAAFVLSVSVPLGQAQRSRPGMEAARLEESAAPLALSGQRRNAQVTLRRLTAKSNNSAEQLETLRERIIPAAERAVELYQRGFERGRYSLFELNAAQQTLLEARSDAIDAAERYHLATFDRKALVGQAPGSGGEL